MTERRLFVGGPWDGRIEPVPLGSQGDRVQVPLLSTFPWYWTDAVEHDIYPCSVVTYERRAFSSGDAAVNVMVVQDASAGDVFHAICKAAGLEPRRWQPNGA